MLVRPPRSPLVPLLSLTLVLGLCFIQVCIVYTNIVTSSLQLDYRMLATMIASASHDPFKVPTGLEGRVKLSYVQGYFDPLLPILNRVFHLTDSPFRLLGLQTLAILSAPIITWVITVKDARLRPFQVLLPAAFLLHPTMALTLQADYHTSGIGLSFFLVGTYLFLQRSYRSSFVLLLIGSLTKISYWPCWIMFGVFHAFRRRSIWAAAYIVIGVSALVLYSVIQPPTDAVAAPSVFFSQLGSTNSEIVINVILKPYLWVGKILDPVRWEFFALLLLPFGFAIFRRPEVLLFVAPLVLFTFMDITGFRAMIYNVYAIEYLGFFVAAVLLGLSTARPRLQALLAVMMCGGLLFTLTDAQSWLTWRPSFASARVTTSEYLRAVELSTCAVGDAPVLATSLYWASYPRGRWDTVWMDDFGQPVSPAIWESVETLVFPGNPLVTGSLASFPVVTLPFVSVTYSASDYAALMDRLPVTVTIEQSAYRWRLLGGQRLAECAARFGYPTSRTTPGRSLLLPRESR
jgi:uncharacterized membrane protein